MGFEKIRSIRPLTKLMLELLQDCYHREKYKLDPPVFYDTELIQGLIDRGLVEKKPNNEDKGKLVFLTELGKEYMKHYFGI